MRRTYKLYGISRIKYTNSGNFKENFVWYRDLTNHIGGKT